MDLKDLRVDHFQPLVGDTFIVEFDGEDRVPLVLIEAESKPTGGGRMESFSLLFKGPTQAFLPQSTYEVQHDGLGNLPLFLVPVAEQPDGFAYESIFTRLTPDAGD